MQNFKEANVDIQLVSWKPFKHVLKKKHGNQKQSVISFEVPKFPAKRFTEKHRTWTSGNLRIGGSWNKKPLSFKNITGS